MTDVDDFTSFVRVHERALIRTTWAITGDRGAGEDVAQVAFERVWHRWGRLSAAGDPWAYTQRVAVNQAISLLRRRRRGREGIFAEVPEQADREVDLRTVESRSMAELWLSVLPPRQRAVVVLRYLCDIPVEETAQILRCSPGTIKSQTAKALDHLRREFAGHPVMPTAEQ